MQNTVVDFSDIDLSEIDLFDVQVLDSSDSVAFPETGASRHDGLLGSCSCSCCWANDDIIGGG
jgi:Thiopeptide-type bacteriocin precursor